MSRVEYRVVCAFIVVGVVAFLIVLNSRSGGDSVADGTDFLYMTYARDMMVIR